MEKFWKNWTMGQSNETHFTWKSTQINFTFKQFTDSFVPRFTTYLNIDQILQWSIRNIFVLTSNCEKRFATLICDDLKSREYSKHSPHSQIGTVGMSVSEN